MEKKLPKTYQDIKALKIQGATAIAKAIISALKNYGVNYQPKTIKDWESNIKKAAFYLLSARPTEPLAQNGIKFILLELKKVKPKNTIQAKNCLKKTTDEFLHLMENAAKLIIPFGRSIIKNNDNVLTHCHSWLVEQILISTKKSNKKFQVFNTETRPFFQGRITSKQLVKAGVDTTMITDSSAGFLISRHSGKNLMIDKIIIGADAILKNGVAINKIGSFGIAVAAFTEKVPIYVAAPLLKFHPASWIKIEERSPKEIWPQAPKKLKIINFAFDLIPPEYITGFITEFGIIKPKNLRKILKKYYPWILNNKQNYI